MPPVGTTVGSWFPTGYYGHVRSKPRGDYVCEYRQLAKPQPPCKFVARSLISDDVHPFSVHDNRNSFLSDAVYFEQGMGRKRTPGKGPIFKQDFYAWMPLQKELSRSLPHLSTYQCCFSKDGVQQLLVHPPKTYPEKSDTTYHYTYDENCPHKDGVKQVAQPSLRLNTLARGRTAIRRPPRPRESVASCLNWHRGPRVLRPSVETDLTHLPYVPAPPQTAKPEDTPTVSFLQSHPQGSKSEVLSSQVVWSQPAPPPQAENPQTVCPPLVPSETECLETAT
ncbi:hypothetical protein ACOMHN_059194 [Nucella lapillus]